MVVVCCGIQAIGAKFIGLSSPPAAAARAPLPMP